MADIRNAYLQSPTSQKHYSISGPEFGMENVGIVASMHRAGYGGKHVEEISEAILDHACNSSIILPVKLILMFG